MIGAILKAGAKLVAKELTTSAAINAGTKIGEAIGQRVAAKLNPPPKSGAKP